MNRIIPYGKKSVSERITTNFGNVKGSWVTLGIFLVSLLMNFSYFPIGNPTMTFINVELS